VPIPNILFLKSSREGQMKGNVQLRKGESNQLVHLCYWPFTASISCDFSQFIMQLHGRYLHFYHFLLKLSIFTVLLCYWAKVLAVFLFFKRP